MRRRLGIALLVLAGLAGALFVVTFATSTLYRIPSSAMEPTMHCARPGAGCLAGHRDRVVVSRVLYRLRDPRRGDIVAFRVRPIAAVACGAIGGEGVTFIKRVVALPGERWSERGGFIHINDRRLNEPYVKADRRGIGRIPERTVPKDRYVVLGDNRASSCDSRRWGTISRDDIVGPVIATYWPLSRISVR